MVNKLTGGSVTECFRPACNEQVYRESAYIHQGRLFCSDTCQQWLDADLASVSKACYYCEQPAVPSLITSDGVRLAFCENITCITTFLSFPCHQKNKSEWCDHEGLGGFMGHTCQPIKGKRTDMIKPDYYHTESVYEPFKIIRYYGLNFFEGNVLKYLLRAGKKAPATRLKDLQKAATYLASEIEETKKEK